MSGTNKKTDAVTQAINASTTHNDMDLISYTCIKVQSAYDVNVTLGGLASCDFR